MVSSCYKALPTYLGMYPLVSEPTINNLLVRTKFSVKGLLLSVFFVSPAQLPRADPIEDMRYIRGTLLV